MKKKILLLLPFFLLLLAAVWGLAAGDAGDPLVSLSYLEGTFTDAVNSRVDQKLDASDAALLSGAELSVPSGDTSSWAESRLKQADALMGPTGVSVMLLAGQGVDAMSGARNLRRIIQEQVENPLSELVLAQPEVRRIVVSTENGTVSVHTCTPLLAAQ